MSLDSPGQRLVRSHATNVLMRALDSASIEINFLISTTPTGPRRDTLTECNMELMTLVEKVKELPSELLPE